MRLETKNAGFRYGGKLISKGRWIFRNIDFSMDEGEIVGLVGPSGYGKTTFIKMLAGYEKPVEGKVLVDGMAVSRKGIAPVQMISQHPENAVNPRWKMKQVLAEAGVLHDETLEAMGIEKAWLERFPRELSGGELQRFCIARSLIGGVRFLLADEISAMLDVITQAQTWELILSEVKRRNLGLLVVTHNASLAGRICQRTVNLQ